MDAWSLGAALATFYLFFKGTAPRRADLPAAASPEMEGTDEDFPDVGSRTGTELIPAPPSPTRNPFETAEK